MRDLQFTANQITADLTSASPDYVLAPRVEKGRHLKITHVTVENKTSNATKLRLFIERSGVRHYKVEQDAPVANRLYVYDNPLHLTENDRLGVEYTGHNAGDDVVINYEGFTRDNPFHDLELEQPSRVEMPTARW